MPSITIELPDSAYRAALSFPPDERMRLGAIALSAAFTTAEAAAYYGEEDDPPTNAAHIEAIRESLTEEQAAQDIDGDVFMAELRKRRGWKK